MTLLGESRLEADADLDSGRRDILALQAGPQAGFRETAGLNLGVDLRVANLPQGMADSDPASLSGPHPPLTYGLNARILQHDQRPGDGRLEED
jgi:hypothetical protein